jgi:hypothetical protein
MKGEKIRDRDTTSHITVDDADYETLAAQCVSEIDIDDDVAQFFYLSEDVNAALRLLISEGRAADPKGIEITIPRSAIDLDDDAPEEYDFTGKTPVHIGPLFLGAPITSTCVTVTLDVYRHFPGTRIINDALRTLIDEGRVPQRRNE